MKRELSLLVLAVVALVSCHHKPKPQQQPVMTIEVARVRVDTVVMRYEFVSHLNSNYDAVVQPRVNGYLLKKSYSAGMPVRRGELLFLIDANLLNTSVRAAEASLAAAEAQAVEARSNYERAVPLAEINAISRSQLDQYTAQYRSAESSVRSARQSLESARLQAGYTRIYSPIDGVVAYAEVHEGDYVGPGTQFSTLTTISNLDSLSAQIAIPTSLYMRHAEQMPNAYDNRGLLSDIELYLADGSRYEYGGRYDYTQQNISPTGGTITLVVKFPNPDFRLKAGEFARVVTGVGARTARVLIPQQSVSRIQGVESVWVVKADSTVEYRPIVTSDSYGREFVVERGLAPDEWVAVTGLQKLHSGMKVIPQKTN